MSRKTFLMRASIIKSMIDPIYTIFTGLHITVSKLRFAGLFIMYEEKMLRVTFQSIKLLI